MKSIIFLFIIIFSTTNIYSQTYTISFVATGTFTTLDSVIVKNYTHPDTVKCLSGDILQLIINNGINETYLNNEKIQVYPNPMQDQAQISFYAKQTGNATLVIYDINGKQVLQTVVNLSQGTQNFRLTGFKQGMCFLNISGENYYYSAKLININSSQANAKIELLGSGKLVNINRNEKSVKETVVMNYNVGDYIHFTGYSGAYTFSVSDVPAYSKTITFCFDTITNCGTITDIDGNLYNTVQIGTQCWMKENLITSNYNNNTSIPNVTDETEWASLVTGAWCYYDNYDFYSYGKFYNWYAISTGMLCPTGWHIPTDTEWTTLTTYLGGLNVAGGKLKEIGTSHWHGPNTGADNSSGFTGLPGGVRYASGQYWAIGEYGHWWSSTEYATNKAYLRVLYKGDSKVGSVYDVKTLGLSVRCIRD